MIVPATPAAGRRAALLAGLVAVGALASACTSADAGAGATAASSEAASTVATVAPTTTAAPTPYYVSIGDSYAAGYEAGIGTTENGFAYQVVDGAAAQSLPLELVNFGCGGATTTSVLEAQGCAPEGLGPGAAPYDGQTQIEAAEAFLREHPGEVELITVSIGGNDVTACGLVPDPVSCVTTAVQTISTNLPQIVQRLRDAAGPDTLIVGTTYPDVILGDWVLDMPNGQDLAKLSVTAFQSIINPALQKAYTDVGGQFVDVTAATGAYGSLDETTALAPYGEIPIPVARVCELTSYCERRDIHPNPEGYRLIAGLVLDALVAARGTG